MCALNPLKLLVKTENWLLEDENNFQQKKEYCRFRIFAFCSYCSCLFPPPSCYWALIARIYSSWSLVGQSKIRQNNRKTTLFFRVDNISLFFVVSCVADQINKSKGKLIVEEKKSRSLRA